jgi:hypothetical protein
VRRSRSVRRTGRERRPVRNGTGSKGAGAGGGGGAGTGSGAEGGRGGTGRAEVKGAVLAGAEGAEGAEGEGCDSPSDEVTRAADMVA